MLANNSLFEPVQNRWDLKQACSSRRCILIDKRPRGTYTSGHAVRETSSDTQTSRRVPSTDVDAESPSLWSTVADSASSFTNQLITHFSGSQASEGTLPTKPFALKVFEAAVTKGKEVAATKAPADLTPFLASCGAWEIKHVRRLSALTAIVYKMNEVTDNRMKRTFGLDLVTSSTTCMVDQFYQGESPDEISAEADGMAMPMSELLSRQTDNGGRVEENTPEPIAQMGLSVSLPLPGQAKKFPATTDKVAERLVEVAGSAADTATNILAYAAGKMIGDAALSSFFDVEHRQSKGKKQAAKTSWYPPPRGHKLHADLVPPEAAAPVYSLMDHPDNTQGDSPTFTPWQSPGNTESSSGQAELRTHDHVAEHLNLVKEENTRTVQWTDEQATMMRDTSLCPSEWFVCDEQDTHTRYFVIQGSDSIDHWKMNFALDPVMFEDASLGVKVHRGAYEAAEVLYLRFLPLVEDYLLERPFAKICFTGHSIGGSLATLLMLMYKRRGVIQEHNIATVYTFGAPPVFLEPVPKEDTGDEAQSSSSSSSSTAEGPYKLLSGEGLADQVVRNVILPYDLVPRSMSCDFSPVAEILRNMGAGFAQHCSLSLDGRKHLYAFIGRMMVLQPSSELVFVANDDPHPMLPSMPGLWILTEPETATSTNSPEAGAAPSKEKLQEAATVIPDTVPSGIEALHEAAPPEEAMQAAAAAAAAVAAAQTESSDVFVPPTVIEAVFELMDNPHPLEILADGASYGTLGSISRYHNPEHYTRALARLIHQARSEETPNWGRSKFGDRNNIISLKGAKASGVASPWEGSEHQH